MASFRSRNLSAGKVNGLKQTPKKVNARISSYVIHSSGKTRVKFNRKDFLILQSMKSFKHKKPHATRLQMKISKNL